MYYGEAQDIARNDKGKTAKRMQAKILGLRTAPMSAARGSKSSTEYRRVQCAKQALGISLYSVTVAALLLWLLLNSTIKEHQIIDLRVEHVNG